MSSLKSLSTLILSSILLTACATSPVPQGKININYHQPEDRQNQVSYPPAKRTSSNYMPQEKDLIKEIDLPKQGEIMMQKFEELNQYLIKITR